MYCRQVQSHLDDYILNQIDRELFDQIDNHLKECLDCQKRLKTNKQLILELKSITTPDPGDYYWQQMEKSILAKTLDVNNEKIERPGRDKAKPINIINRYLIPLAASFVLLFGAIMLSNSIQNQAQFSSQATKSSSPFILAENRAGLSERSDSQIFTAIVAAAPGSLGRHLIFTNISGGSR